MQKDVWFYKASDRYTKGIPDIMVCARGKLVGLELKAPNGKPSANQILTIRKIQEAGGIAGVCYTLQDVITLIELARCDQ